eukprot:1186095-Pyramimonas_sp.AAC.2
MEAVTLQPGLVLLKRALDIDEQKWLVQQCFRCRPTAPCDPRVELDTDIWRKELVGELNFRVMRWLDK